jgi:hypothetical protein
MDWAIPPVCVTRPVGRRRAEVQAEQAPCDVLDLLRRKGLQRNAGHLVAGEEVEHTGGDTGRVRRG